MKINVFFLSQMQIIVVALEILCKKWVIFVAQMKIWWLNRKINKTKWFFFGSELNRKPEKNPTNHVLDSYVGKTPLTTFKHFKTQWNVKHDVRIMYTLRRFQEIKWNLMILTPSRNCSSLGFWEKIGKLISVN